MTLSPGQIVLGRYAVESLLGEGGMGQVYKARHMHLDSPVALKVLVPGPDPDLPARFAREAKLMARVRHPNVVAVLDYGMLDGNAPCIVMEYLEGEPLADQLERCGRLPWGEALDIVQQVLAGLSVAHAAEIVHRDIKPSNVMMLPGAEATAKLIDFGIARSTREGTARYTQSGAIIGTPAYMAPEQLMGQKVDHRTDLYAVGLMFYELVTGALPHGSTEMSAVFKRAMGDVPPIALPVGAPEPPIALVAEVLRALQTEPSARRETAQAMRDALAVGARLDADVTAPVRVSIADAATVSAPRSMPAAHAGGARLLLAARVPPSRLALADERRWLSELVLGAGRGFVLGAQHWFAVLSVPAHSERADAIVQALRARYGDATPIAVEQVAPSFQLTAASLSGAEPLPEALATTLAKL